MSTMDTNTPEDPKGLERAADGLGMIVDFDELRAKTDMYHGRLRAAQSNPRENPAEVEHLRQRFERANAELLALKPIEDKFQSDLEEVLSNPSSSESD